MKLRRRLAAATLLPLLAGGAGAACTASPGDYVDTLRGTSQAVVRVLSIRWQAPDEAEDSLAPSPSLPASPFPERAAATGFFAGEDGIVASSAHAVRGASETWVGTGDGELWKARLVGVDSRLDLAVLRIEAHSPRLLRIAADEPRPGQWVTAIGTPFGLEQSVSAGVVSAFPRELPGSNGLPMIQTDVALNPGNSGGPLLDACGEVVGMNSMVFSPHGFYTGVSFSVPATLLGPALAAILKNGNPAHFDLHAQTVTPALRRAFGAPREGGAVVVQLRAGGEAASAGVRVGDIITLANGHPVTAADDLRLALAGVRPGQRIALDLWREGALKRGVSVKAVGEDGTVDAASADEPAAARDRVNRLGLQLARFRAAPGRPGRLEVVSVAGAGLVAGVEEGDGVLAMNGRAVATPDEFDRALEAAVARGANLVALLVERDGVPFYVSVPAPAGASAAAGPATRP